MDTSPWQLRGTAEVVTWRGAAPWLPFGVTELSHPLSPCPESILPPLCGSGVSIPHPIWTGLAPSAWQCYGDVALAVSPFFSAVIRRKAQNPEGDPCTTPPA